MDLDRIMTHNPTGDSPIMTFCMKRKGSLKIHLEGEGCRSQHRAARCIEGMKLGWIGTSAYGEPPTVQQSEVLVVSMLKVGHNSITDFATERIHLQR
jgi:hypothetical protein